MTYVDSFNPSRQAAAIQAVNSAHAANISITNELIERYVELRLKSGGSDQLIMANILRETNIEMAEIFIKLCGETVSDLK